MASSAESRPPGGAPEEGWRPAPPFADMSDAGAHEPAARETAVTGPVGLARNVFSAVSHDLRWLFGLILVAMVGAAIVAPLVAPHDPLLYHPQLVGRPPSATYVLGTDSLGRDILSRVIYGTRISLSVGLVSVLLGGLIGTGLGMAAGYLGGWVDRIISIFVDVLLAFPSLILALALAATLGASFGSVTLAIPLGFTTLRFPVNTLNLVIALAVVRIPVYTRLARGQTLYVRSLDYVKAAQTLGSRTWWVMRRHVLPNISSALLVQVTISISFAILDESVLSFLGLGAPPPTPEWGSMIFEAQPFLINGDPWMILGPVLALVLTVLSLNLFGDALRDRLDPRSATREARAR
ncbi:MAG TPA: ABC transporter permease [Ktedonobacterales bacterium]|jgi:peptide/nickel transport system permease protein